MVNIDLRNKIFPRSPLRYPGGKSRAVKLILELFPKRMDVLVSPFIGGGSVEIAASSLGIKVIGYDIFNPLVNFYHELLNNPLKLADEVRKYFPLSKAAFYYLQKYIPNSTLESAAIFYVLNRCSFSGSTYSGGMSPGHPRFTESSIEYLMQFKAPTMTVLFGDFHDTLLQHKNEFLYLDPPYLIQNNLYGKKGDAHKNFDHFGLKELLSKRNNWVLSYNDCKEIREMYKDYKIISAQWKYGMSNNKFSAEVLIINNI